MPQAAITLCNEILTPDPVGALFWSAQETLIVSDLHFEKGSSFAARGVMLPPYDTRATLHRLEALIARYRPRRVISLGDAFHDGAAEARMDDQDAAHLERLMSGVDWLWILGNHDPEPPARFAAATAVEHRIGPFIFRHEPVDGPAEGEICGHLHPCARIAIEGRSLRRRCFARCADGERLVMPAMGAFTGGLNILDDAYARVIRTPVAWAIGKGGVYPISASRLAPDPVRLERRRA